MSAPRTLVVSRHSPYGCGLARAALDTALAAAAFDHPPVLLFLGAGVLQLLPDQDAAVVGTRTHGKVLDSLPLYDLDTFYVDAAALAAFGIDPAALPAGARLLDDAALRELMAGCDHILGF
ncbi:MAG: sulfurtransferase complex subunit TusC [Parahaliea sp.]